MPVVKETKAHILIAAHARHRNSQGGSSTQLGSPKREFKMKRFADVQGKISTNIPRKQPKVPASVPVELADSAQAYGLEASQPEPTPAQPEEQKQELN